MESISNYRLSFPLPYRVMNPLFINRSRKRCEADEHLTTGVTCTKLSFHGDGLISGNIKNLKLVSVKRLTMPQFSHLKVSVVNLFDTIALFMPHGLS